MNVGDALVDGYDLVIFDLDGVVYVGTEAVAGAAQAVAALRGNGVAVEYATNNASRRADEVAELLASVGVPATGDEVLTSAEAAARWLADELPAGAPVLVVGAPALVADVAAAGLTPVDRADAAPVAVVQGYGPQVGWAELAEACVAVRAGARWIATNTDATLPSTRGPLPGNGSLVAALSTALGRAPDVVVGKPEPTLFQIAAKRHGARRPLVVGDRLDTDIEGANRAGMDSLLVLTGVAGPMDVLRAPAAQRPTYLAADLGALGGAAGAARVPPWNAEPGVARAGGWRVTRDGGRLLLDGAGEPFGALLALTAAAWANPELTLAPAGDDAAEVFARIGVRGVSAA